MFRSQILRFAPALSLALLAGLLAVAGCGPPSISVNRDPSDMDDPLVYDDPQSPDALVDRLGEPNEWKNEGEGDRLRMTAIWYCVDGHRREVTWRIAEGSATRRSWQLIEDRRLDADCP